MLISGGNLYVAGHVLQAVNPSSGEKLVQINASPQFSGGTFLYPLADQKLLVAGYFSARAATKTALYAIDPQTNRVRWKVPSLSAEGSLGIGRILTQTLGGSEFYDESSGRGLAKEPRVSGDWFAGPDLAYTVALVKRTATLYAVDGTGRTVWHHAVGPYVATSGWAHAISASAVYVRRLAPSDGVAAYDPNSGKLLWSRHILNIQKLALANGILFVLTYSLGEPVRLIYLRADTGAVIGNRAVLLSAGYYAFSAPNELMVANGMLFICAVGPKGSQLVALGL
jgi:outer membrane protein assembly factor BamB